MKGKQWENITVKKVWTCRVNYKNLVKFCFEFLQEFFMVLKSYIQREAECFLSFQNILKLINKGDRVGGGGGGSFQFN